MQNEGEGIYFVGLIDKQKDFEKLHIMVPSNVYDYKTEFIKFKEMNNWK